MYTCCQLNLNLPQREVVRLNLSSHLFTFQCDLYGFAYQILIPKQRSYFYVNACR